MAPTKSTKSIIPEIKPLNARARSKLTSNATVKEIRSKRKAASPLAKDTEIKRSALGDVTNVKRKAAQKTVKPAPEHAKVVPSVKTVVKPKRNENVAPLAPITRIQTRGRAKVPNETVQKPKELVKENITTNKVKTRLSNEFEKTEESIYSTPLEEM